MSIKFDWHVDGDEPPGGKNGSASRWFRFVKTGFGVILFVSLLGVFFQARWRARNSEAALRRDMQALLDDQMVAFEQGDGAVFFDTFEKSARFRATQLMPLSRQYYGGSPTILLSRRQGDMIWSNVRFMYDDAPLQRVVFSQETDAGLKQVARDDAFWGELEGVSQPWGELFLFSADGEFADAIGEHLGRALSQNPTTALEVVIHNDFSQFADGRIHFPSPRLIGIGEDGDLSVYLALLTEEVQNYISPQPIRFAVPLELLPTMQAMARDYAGAVEIINLNTLSSEGGALFEAVDGALLVPNEALLAGGHVRDLTDYVNSDLNFDRADFYNQFWLNWQGRTWAVPFDATMRMPFYDTAEWPQNVDVWSWEEMRDGVQAVTEANGRVGLLTQYFDPYFSYAYAHSSQQTLNTSDVVAMLDWFAALGLVEDLAMIEGSVERNHQYLQYISSPRRVNLWISDPAEYEHQLQLAPVGIAAWPTDERLVSIAPLTVRSGVISAYSAQPAAMWRWLSYLSHQSGGSRAIPARPSVAETINFWQRLPEPINRVMRNAFPNARAITYHDQTLLNSDVVEAVFGQGIAPVDALAARQPIRWFNAK